MRHCSENQQTRGCASRGFWLVSSLLVLVHASAAQLSGPLSGTLGPGIYHIGGRIWIEADSTLRLLPPTTFIFDGSIPFEIYGTLLAEGTASDSIVFTTFQSGSWRWRGLRFLGTVGPYSRLSYCLIEKAFQRDRGGAVYCEHSSPIFTNCVIRGSRATSGGGLECWSAARPRFTNCVFSNNAAYTDDGGAVHCFHYSSPWFVNCVFEGNSAAFRGGGIFCDYYSSPSFSNCLICADTAVHGGGVYCGRWSSPTFTNCTIDSNQASENGGGVTSHDGSSPTFTECTINHNRAIQVNGGGVECWEASANFTDCTIGTNSANSYGGGLYCLSSGPTLVNCVLSTNAAGGGGGVCCWSSSPTFVNCMFSRNSARGGGGVECLYSAPSFLNCLLDCNTAENEGGAAYCGSYSSPSFTSCTLSGNSANIGAGVYCWWSSSPIFSSTIISFSGGSGIYFFYGERSHFEYCDIFGNTGGDITFVNNDPSNGPPGIGQIFTTNDNGDSCDIYFNIFLDPMFADTAAGNFHLRAGSPCIDAGDPLLPYDPDSTIADIGAFYFYQVGVETSIILLPTEFVLYPNWPNPFNATTSIRYDMPVTGKASLTVFNLLGQRVATLVNGQQLAGSHTISWDASDLPSGVYLCRMQVAGFAQTRKMILLK
jgi:parallel beta-helix repeat protein/predicted outer membrane repeat protein